MALQPEIRTDSLAGQLSDSLPTTETALRESIFRLRDSLATIPPDTLQATPPVTAEELFGAGSTLAIEPFPTQSVRPIYESAPFQGIVLALVFAYLVIIYHNLREVYILCRKLSLDRSKPGRMTDTQGSTYTRFLWAAIGIGLPMLALLTLTDGPLVPHPRGRPRSLDPGTGTARYGRPGRSPAFPGRTAPDHGLRHPLPTDHRSACSAKIQLFSTFCRLSVPVDPTLPAGFARHRAYPLFRHPHPRRSTAVALPERVAHALSLEKNFDFALVFVPLCRRNFSRELRVALADKNLITR